MTTATTIPESCTVTATVDGKEEVENGILLRLTIPQFKSKYPVPVRVTPDVAAALKVGQSLAVALAREKLKADKAGRYYTDYYWGWSEKQPDSRQVVTGVTPEPETPAAERRDATGISIERQKALDLAGRDYWEFCRVKGVAPKSLSHAATEISGLACAYAKWTIGQGKPVPLIERMPDAVPPSGTDPAVTLGLADDVQAAQEPKQGAQATTAPQKAKEGECEIASDTCVKIAADFTDRGKIMSHFGAFHKVGISEAQACFPLTSDGQRQTIQNLSIAQLLEACKQAAQHA